MKYVYTVRFDNDNTAFTPEIWAMESLAILQENMVVGNLVHRDFENLVARFGDTVNTRKPNEFVAQRKDDSESVTVQDASSVNIPVTLNQHIHTSFMIKDGEESLAFEDLVNIYLQPAVLSIAQQIDRVVSARFAQVAFSNITGHLGTAPAKNDVLNLRNVMNKNKAYMQNRNLILPPDTETALLQVDEFTEAFAVGDDGTALREAALGRKFGFNVFMAQNQAGVLNGTTKASTTLTAGAAAGAVVIAVTASTGMTVGSFVTVGTDMTPQIITAIATLNISIWPGLKTAAPNAAPVTTYKADTVNQSSATVPAGGDGTTAGYRAGWHGWIVQDAGGGQAGVPEVGQMVTFGTGATTGPLAAALSKYVVISADVAGTRFQVDRPLDVAIADGGNINFGPIGNYALAFHKNAFALITRPLAAPKPGTGALSSVAQFNGLGLRVTITYNGSEQGHLVTVDTLCGVANLDLKLAAVLFG